MMHYTCKQQNNRWQLIDTNNFEWFQRESRQKNYNTINLWNSYVYAVPLCKFVSVCPSFGITPCDVWLLFPVLYTEVSSNIIQEPCSSWDGTWDSNMQGICSRPLSHLHTLWILKSQIYTCSIIQNVCTYVNIYI